MLEVPEDQVPAGGFLITRFLPEVPAGDSSSKSPMSQDSLDCLYLLQDFLFLFWFLASGCLLWLLSLLA